MLLLELLELGLNGLHRLHAAELGGGEGGGDELGEDGYKDDGEDIAVVLVVAAEPDERGEDTVGEGVAVVLVEPAVGLVEDVLSVPGAGLEGTDRRPADEGLGTGREARRLLEGPFDLLAKALGVARRVAHG